jgi:nucleoside phosphorylase
VQRGAEILLVAATEPELCGHGGLVCGVGPVEAAAATARALASAAPAAVVHIGLAGARRGAGIAVGSLVVGDEARYEDLATSRPLAPDRVAAAPALVATACRELDTSPVAIGTSASVGGARGCDVEAMEGFAVLRAAELAGVPAVEVRAISNHVGDARGEWRLEEALAALGLALPGLLVAIAASLPEAR